MIFCVFQSHMDLPPDKLKIVKMLPDEKKIQFLRSLRFVNEKQPPEYYIQALSTYTDVICDQKTSKRSKANIMETSTELIKNLEVSLRTNRIEWVHKFLDPPLNGLDVLVEYLQSTLNFMKESERYTNLSNNNSVNSSSNGGHAGTSADGSGINTSGGNTNGANSSGGYDSNMYPTLNSQGTINGGNGGGVNGNGVMHQSNYSNGTMQSGHSHVSSASKSKFTIWKCQLSFNEIKMLNKIKNEASF